MSALNFDPVVQYLRPKCGNWITDKSDRLVVTVISVIASKTTGARSGISPVAVVVNVVVLDGNSWLVQSGEDNASTRGISYFESVDGDVRTRALSISGAVDDSIQACGTTVQNRKVPEP